MDPEESVSIMSSLLTDIGSVVTAAIGWVEDFAESIAGNDLLILAVVAVPLVGLGVGLLRRLISLNA